MGLSALKNSFSDLPLSEDKVQDTLIEIESVLEQHRDIENVLSQGIAGASDEATESDLEDELRDILAESEHEAHLPPASPSSRAQEPELVLPSVPTDSPTAASSPASETPMRVAAQR